MLKPRLVLVTGRPDLGYYDFPWVGRARLDPILMDFRAVPFHTVPFEMLRNFFVSRGRRARQKSQSERPM